jgi:hypothetical protein
VAFTPDGTKLLTAGADHGVLVWSVRVRDVSLPEGWRRETSAAKLWDLMARGPADEAYLAAARLAADPVAAVKMARLRVTPGSPGEPVVDVRAVELLEAVGTEPARAFLRELAAIDAVSMRGREAVQALERLGDPRSKPGGKPTTDGCKP